jgi:hypothetical protein
MNRLLTPTSSLLMLFTVFLVCLAAPAAARAETIDVFATTADITGTAQLSGTPGSVLDVFVEILNPSPTQTAYLNADSFTTDSAYLTVDDSPFTSPTSEVPLSLGPDANTGISTPVELFAVDVAADAPSGTYSGNVFSILGGTSGSATCGPSATCDLNNLDFTVTVATVTPEPSSIMLSVVAGLVLLIGGLRRRTA